MPSSTVSVPGADGAFAAWLAEPAGAVRGAIVVIQEIFGVNAVMRAIADDYARQGYVACVPDLFWRIEPGVALTDQTEAEWQKAFSLYSRFDVASGVVDIQATIAFLRARFGVKTGAVGYCLGGLLAFLTATRTDVDAATAFYAVGAEGFLDELPNVRAPLMMHIAGQDKFVPAEAQQKILAAIATLAEATPSGPRVEAFHYPGCDHAFARVGGAHFDATAAGLANQRTAEFLARSIG